MFTTIISWLVFLTIVGGITAAVWAITYAIYTVMSEEDTVTAVLFLGGLFGTVFSLMAPFVFNGVIPANNWGLAIGITCWFVVMPACAMLSVWAIERK